mmetsp:Transcript_5995/g.16124  ORF Transcript_5995/g.16124 Transcript_5995/m.16124 type:complete len:311 (+) Transcript_5995:17-949(+)
MSGSVKLIRRVSCPAAWVTVTRAPSTFATSHCSHRPAPRENTLTTSPTSQACDGGCPIGPGAAAEVPLVHVESPAGYADTGTSRPSRGWTLTVKDACETGWKPIGDRASEKDGWRATLGNQSTVGCGYKTSTSAWRVLFAPRLWHESWSLPLGSSLKNCSARPWQNAMPQTAQTSNTHTMMSTAVRLDRCGVSSGSLYPNNKSSSEPSTAAGSPTVTFSALWTCVELLIRENLGRNSATSSSALLVVLAPMSSAVSFATTRTPASGRPQSGGPDTTPARLLASAAGPCNRHEPPLCQVKCEHPRTTLHLT